MPTRNPDLFLEESGGRRSAKLRRQAERDEARRGHVQTVVVRRRPLGR